MVAPMVDDRQVDGNIIVDADPLVRTRSPPFIVPVDDVLTDRKRPADLHLDRLSQRRAAVEVSALVRQPECLSVC
jgi:hypothetical protein